MISDGTAQFQIVDQKQDGTDIDALKTELEAVKSSLAAVQTAISDAQNFAIIYPNGGTESNPGKITNNKRYIMDNPFHGYYVYCLIQVKLKSGIWGTAETSCENEGARAGQILPDDKIALQTGTNYVVNNNPPYSINPLNSSGYENNVPCRILVYKLGKI